MKVLVLLHLTEEAKLSDIQSLEQDEAAQIWSLYRRGELLEIYISKPGGKAVLLLETGDAGDARDIVNTLPMVAAGQLEAECYPLSAWPDMKRLLKNEGLPTPAWMRDL